MTIEIKITDPHEIDRDALRALAAYLTGITKDKTTESPPAPPSRVSMFTPEEVAAQPDTRGIPPPTAKLDLSAFALAPVPTAPEQRTLTRLPTPTPPPPPPAFAPAYELAATDVKGVPWDGRIHSSSKKKNVDGTWRNRRNATDTAVADVTGELVEAMAAPPASTNSPGALDATPTLNFARFMRLATANGVTDPNYMHRVLEACSACGVPSLPALAVRPDLIPKVVEMLGMQI